MNSSPEIRVMVKSGAALPISNMKPNQDLRVRRPHLMTGGRTSRPSGFRRQSSESGTATVGWAVSSQATAGLWHERISNCFRDAKEPGTVS